MKYFSFARKKCYLREGIFSPSGGLPSRCNYNEKNTCFVWLWCGTNYNWRIRAILSRSEIDSMMVADIAINPQVLGVTGRGNEESKTLGDYKKRPPGVFSGSLSYTFLFLYRVAQKLRYYFGSIYRSSGIILDLFTEGVIGDVVNERDRVVVFSLAFTNRDYLVSS